MHNLCLLLIDDNPIFLRSAVRLLQQFDGIQVAPPAQGGRAGLTKAQELQPEVILIDLNMPDIPGLELIPQLRQLLPDAALIVLTMHDSPRLRASALAAGADDYVVKPDMFSGLEPVIRRVIAARHPPHNNGGPPLVG